MALITEFDMNGNQRLSIKMKRIYKIVLKIITLSFLCAIFTVTIEIALSVQEINKIESADHNIYYSIQHESNPLTIGLNQFQKTYDRLIASFSTEGSQYLEIYFQYLEQPDAKEKLFYTVKDQLQTNALTIQAAQISLNVLDRNCVSDGRYFGQSDFMHQPGSAIPVLLGNDYHDNYAIGDSFHAIYLYQPYEFKVIGFLKEGALIQGGERTASADHYVVMPSFQVSDISRENDGLRIHYANKISGIIRRAEYDDSILSQVLKAYKEGETGACAVQVFPYRYRRVFGISLPTLNKILYAAAVTEFMIYLLVLSRYRRADIRFDWKKGAAMALLSPVILYVMSSVGINKTGLILCNVRSMMGVAGIAFISCVGIDAIYNCQPQMKMS